jgi:hypothetical protein
MSKDKISDYSTINANNTDIGGIDIDENCLPSNLNDAIREVMVQLKKFQDGTSGDPLTITGTATLNGTSIPANKTLVDTDSSQTITNKSYNGSIGSTTPSTGDFTDFTASATAEFTSTGAVKLSAGTTAQRPNPAKPGHIRINIDTDEFEGFNGTEWASVGGSAISDDVTTATELYPVFVDATTGTAADVFVSDGKLGYTPSTGELSASQLVASNGIVVNSATITANYTIPSGSNAMSAGPIEVSSGVEVTVSAGSVWTVI